MSKAEFGTDADTIKTLEKYLLPADISIVACVDERPDRIDNMNGVEFPGGTYGIIDAIKVLTGCTEEQAWERAQAAGIPMGAHSDEHHGVKGCGYGKLVETEPGTVLAPEAVQVEKRHARIEAAGGVLPVLHGEHAPTHATINYRGGTSIDPDLAVAGGFGIFNYDYWAALDYALLLKIEPERFAEHLKEVYVRTVMRLTNGALHTFHEFR